MSNHIEEAYNAGKRIKRKDWDQTEWIKKHNYAHSIDEKGAKRGHDWSFDNYPDEWEILPDEPETPPHPDAIQHAIDLLKANGYEIYQITKTKL